MGGVAEFIIGYVAGVLTLTAVSFAIGVYVFKHPQAMVRRMMGSKRNGNRVDKRETTADSPGG